MASKYNVHLIKERASYSVEEVSSLFVISKKTCLRWIENDGLKVIEENTKPLLIMGKTLKEFLLIKRKKGKVALMDGQYYCLKCHKPVKAKQGSEQVVKTGHRIGTERHEQFKNMAICEFCETKVNRFLGVYRKD